jgi:hypothetical protein
MKTIVPNNIPAIPELKDLVARANEALQADRESSEPDREAEWSLERDERGPDRLELKLSDEHGESAVGRFKPKELRQTNLMRARFYDLWGDLLHGRNKKNLKRLHELIRDL